MRAGIDIAKRHTSDLFAFLTTEPNALVGTYHVKAMPVILTKPEEIDTWLEAPTPVALQLGHYAVRQAKLARSNG